MSPGNFFLYQIRRRQSRWPAWTWCSWGRTLWRTSQASAPLCTRQPFRGSHIGLQETLWPSVERQPWPSVNSSLPWAYPPCLRCFFSSWCSGCYMYVFLFFSNRHLGSLEVEDKCLPHPLSPIGYTELASALSYTCLFSVFLILSCPDTVSMLHDALSWRSPRRIRIELTLNPSSRERSSLNHSGASDFLLRRASAFLGLDT